MAVEERGYGAQRAPARLTALPGADAASFGGDVGRAIAGLGNSMHRAEISAYQVERRQRANQESSDFSVKMAQLQAETEDFERSLKTGDNPLAQPGGAGHQALVTQYFRERAEKLTDGFTETQVIQAGRERSASYLANLSARAGAYEAGSMAAKVQTDAQQYRFIQEARVRRDADPATMGQALEDADIYVDGLAHLNDEQRTAIRSEMTAGIMFAWAGGTAAEQNPVLMRRLLEGGKFDALPSQMREHLFNSLDVLENRQRVAIDKAARDAAQLATNNEDALKAQADDGVATDPNALLAAAARAEAEGKPDRAYQFRQAAVKARTNGIYGEARADQISARMGAIEQTKDWQSRPELVTEHGQLDMLRTKMRDAEANYTAGLDMANPASFAKRERDAAADAQRRGLSVPQPLGEDEIERYRDMAKTGVNGQITVANELANFSSRFAMQAARQIDPGNRMLMVATTLTPSSRALLLRGDAAGKVKPDGITPALLDQKFGKSTSGVLARLGEDYQLGVRQTAEAIADTLIVQRNAKMLTDDIWSEAMHRALGGTWARNGVPQGGMGTWNGKSVLLPYRMSQEDFDKRLSRFGKLNGALTATGEAVSADQLRRYFTPVAVGGGYYHFVDSAGRALKARDGSNAALKITWNDK